MNPHIRTAAVIARRDFHATVVSRTFLLFLIAPLFPVLFGVLFGAVGANMEDKASRPPVLAVSADPPTLALLATAHGRLQSHGVPTLQLQPVSTPIDDPATAKQLLAQHAELSALLMANGATPLLYGPQNAVTELKPYAALLLNETARDRALASSAIAPPAEPRLRSVIIPQSGSEPNERLPILGQISQTLLFILTLMLAGVLLSNFIEERGNKVIEVLAAAAPVPAIFTGKLFAMLGSSLIGIAVWATAALAGFFLLPHQAGAVPDPAVGWPAFVLLFALYFSSNYLLVGALLLGVGAQASSVRQIQTLSLPITMAQLLLYGLASAALNQPGSTMAMAAAVFPFSSPLAMIAWAAERPEFWPHVLALCWQGLWTAAVIVFMSRWFRRGVLKSGPAHSGRSRRFLQKRA